ncbi:MAG: hypothetical protein MZV63_25130 [Marinilabiliales bacterium]|nr:hypothetical protein [Marinilabiliales bacterium]
MVDAAYPVSLPHHRTKDCDPVAVLRRSAAVATSVVVVREHFIQRSPHCAIRTCRLPGCPVLDVNGSFVY